MEGRWNRPGATLGLLIAGAVLALYARTATFGYVFDDRFFILGNPGLDRGLTGEGLRWAFTTTYHANWHPVAWLAHLADRALFGPGPGAAHLVNAGLHAACSVLLLLVLRRLTGALLPSAFVAAAFALHPLRVESVAWVTERKDALSAIFWILGLGAYGRYARRPGGGRYLLLVVLFVLGLMTKPMLVTFPGVLLLLDWWPLGRFRARGVLAHRLLLEKLPLALLAGAAAAAAVLSQGASGAVSGWEAIPPGPRFANAAVAYATYLVDTSWPARLAVYYPHPGPALFGWRTAGAVLLLAWATFLALRRAREIPALAVGWLWYLGTLVPVIGFVQVGGQGHADRFTYLPSIGLLAAFAWAVRRIAARLPAGPGILTALALAALAALSAASWRQIGSWRDDVTLFSRALAVTKDNGFAENNLGFALEERGDLAAAMTHYEAALRIRPDDAAAHFNRGSALEKLGRRDEAAAAYRKAVLFGPDSAEAHARLGVLLAERGERAAAIEHYRLAVRGRPGIAVLHMNLANVLSDEGEFAEALAHYGVALRLAPTEAKIHANRGVTHAQMGNAAAATADYREALRLDPGNATARRGLRYLMLSGARRARGPAASGRARGGVTPP